MINLKESAVKNLSIIDPVQRRVLEKLYGLNGETAIGWMRGGSFDGK